MPKTRFQKIIFASLMAIAMVYGMEVYNAAIRRGGLSNAMFKISPFELIMLSIVVIALQEIIGGPLARKLAFRLVNPEKDRAIAVVLAVSVMTVCVMCPIMSLIATVLFKDAQSELFAKWLQTVAINFPMALSWQIFVAGPLVRLICRSIFGIFAK
ncbi:MAG: DUF2798 domain-containing protein [Clostridia bacterium]|nr:DUF2798 domain-containing protein [Clostridia bacterium]